MKRFWVAFLFLAVLISLSCRARTEEDRLDDFLTTLIQLAEEKNLASMMTYFSEDFVDFEGRTKAGIRDLLGSYFSGRTGIVVHELSTRIEDIQQDKATLLTEVALSSGAAEALRRLVKISPDHYRFKVELVKKGEGWLIRYAEWSSVSLVELFPESLVNFKKLFPDLRR